MLRRIWYQGTVTPTSGHGVKKDQGLSPLGTGARQGRGGTWLLPAFLRMVLGGWSSGEHLQQRVLSRAFLLRVSWQFFRASETVSAVGS